MTHFLPGGGVPRVHGARSPVPPRLPYFATPRSVRHFATLVAGAYPLRHPPDAWSPGLPAPPGPCYWLVASVTPMGWRRGCLAVGLVRSTLCYYCLGGCSALVVCARRSRLAWQVGAVAGSCFFPWAPPCPRVPRGACSGLSRRGVSSLRLPVRHSMQSVRSAGLVRLPFGSSPRVPYLCVRSCSGGVHASPFLRVGAARALRAILVHGAGRAVPGRSCLSVFPAAVPSSAYLARGGRARSLRPLALLGVMRPPAGRLAFLCCLCALWGRQEGARGGGASCLGVGRPGSGALPSPTVRPLGCAVRAHYALAVGAGSAGLGTRHQPHSAGSCKLPLGGRLLPGCGASGVGRSPTPDRLSFGACGRGQLPSGCGCGGCGPGDPPPTPQCALL